MAPDRLPEPWRAFLADIDRQATGTLVLHCIGGLAVSLYYGLARPAGDLAVVEVAPSDAKVWLASLAGQGSALHQKH
jgi:hypothetical protein